MKDAFKKKIELGSDIIYSIGGSAGTQYVIGKVVKLYPCKKDPLKGYNPPDRVSVEPTKTTNIKFEKNPIIYASNVVVLPIKL